jgi:uncharacterized protein DUF4386
MARWAMSRAAPSNPTTIAVGICSVISVLTLRDDLAAGSTGLGTVERALVAVHDATFLLGPAFCAGFGNGVLLGTVMYRSGLGVYLIVKGFKTSSPVLEASRRGALDEAFAPAAG